MAEAGGSQFGDFTGRDTRDKEDIKYQFEELTGQQTPFFILDGMILGIKEIRLIVKTRLITGEAMIWGHPSQGIWGANKWSLRSTLYTFILDHPLAGKLDDQKLTRGSLILGHPNQSVLGWDAVLGAWGADWQTVIDESYDP